MKRSRSQRAAMRASCGEIHDDDGVDPREFFSSRGQRRKNDRKAYQLCHQVSQIIQLVLAGEFDDDLLLSLQVVSVTPASGSGLLEVQLHCKLPPHEAPLEAIAQRLREVTPYIRSQVAQGVTRKHAPKLMFRLSQRGSEGEVNS